MQIAKRQHLMLLVMLLVVISSVFYVSSRAYATNDAGEPTVESVTESVTESTTESTTESVTESTTESTTESVQEIVPAVAPVVTAAAGSDVKALLTNLSESVTQNGNPVVVGGTLEAGDTISVNVSFGVPVVGDYPTPANPVQKGDTATFILGDSFTLASGTVIPLEMGTITVGHVTFITDPTTNVVTALVVFDGDDDVFNGEYNTVTCEFNASFTYDMGGEAGEVGEHTVTILEKEYTVVVPAPEVVFDLTKSGEVNWDTQTIKWTTIVSATQADVPIDLAGYKFSDDLTNVGVYVPNSFAVGGVTQTPTLNGSKILYTFPASSTSAQTVTFETAIVDSLYYSSGTKTVNNKAQLLDSEGELKTDGSTKVTFTPQWIEKSGSASASETNGVYNPANRTITWTITANKMEKTLTGVVITDVIPSGLTFDSAKAESPVGTELNSWTSAPVDGKYEIGAINKEVVLTIVTKVPDEDYTTKKTTYNNSATITWAGLPEGTIIGTGNIGVGVGYNAITKSGKVDVSTRSVTWTVNVNLKGQQAPDLKVYDLLVYGSNSSGFSTSTTTGYPAGLNAADLVPRYDQKYIDGSFANSTGLTVVSHPIMKNGVRVADLLEISGLSNSVNNSFTFKSLVVNPNIFAGNAAPYVYNAAVLFTGTTKIGRGSARVAYPSNLLAKEMLNRDAVSDPAAGVNNKTTGSSNGFDYQDKSVVFRLSVNGDGIDLNNMTDSTNVKLGTTTVTDTLPAGWEFVPIVEGGSDYYIFDGLAENTKSVTASSTTPLSSVAGLTADIGTSTATFTFTDLSSPYVILIKARPTDETVVGYFDSNKTSEVTNHLRLDTANWKSGITSSQDVSIKSEILNKTVVSPAAGVLHWTVDYKPYELEQTGTKLEDVLPVGIDLRTDSNGTILLTDDDLSAHEMTLAADGSYVVGNKIPLVLGENIFYDAGTRTLTFSIADSTQAYRFMYVTDITGQPGKVSNKVSLIGQDGNQEDVAFEYSISEADGKASLQRNGWIEITKVNGAGEPLEDVEFTLFASDGTTVIRQGLTGADGKVKFRVIPDGEYTFQETGGLQGYVSDTSAHALVVSSEGLAVDSSIDGKAGEGSNLITIKNYLVGTVGNLEINKTVAGNEGDSEKKFDLTVTFEGAEGVYDYIGQGVPDGTIASGDTISLADGESILITGLPMEATYSVEEADYSEDGYVSVSTGAEGTIVVDDTQTASFTNTKNVIYSGNLTISKSVTGTTTNKKFDFTVEFTGATETYEYTGKGVLDGTITSGDTISLGDDQSITITGLPEGTTYQISESSESSDGYTVESVGESGTITKDGSAVAAFTNAKNNDSSGGPNTGSLNISKVVTGEGANLDRKFDFTVTFTGASGSYPYTGDYTGTISSGDVISLADGERIHITDLPRSARYKVTEADYTDLGYTTTSEGAESFISGITSRKAVFTNTWTGPTGDAGIEGNVDEVDNGNVTGDGNTAGQGDPQDVTNGGTYVIPRTGDEQIFSPVSVGILGIFAAAAAFFAAFRISRKKELKKI